MLFDGESVYWDREYGAAYIDAGDRDPLRIYNKYAGRSNRNKALRESSVTIKKKGNYILLGYATPGKFPQKKRYCS